MFLIVLAILFGIALLAASIYPVFVRDFIWPPLFRLRHHHWVAAVFAVLVLQPLFFAASAMAADATTSATSSIADMIVPLILAALPGLVVAGLAWLKARAAHTAAQWDDAAVKFVEDVATRIVNQKTPSA